MDLQGFGYLAAGIVAMVVSAAFANSSPGNNDFVWRIILMFGAIPATLTYYWRMKMPETARYTALVEKDSIKAASDMSSVLHMDIVPKKEAAATELSRQEQYGLLSGEFLRRHGRHLLGCTVCWLVLDITFYSLYLFMKDVFTKVSLLPDPSACDPLKRMIKITKAHTAVALCATLPGYFFTVAFVDRIGRVRIQLLGFAMMSIFILCLALPYSHWTEHGNRYVFGVMYAMIFFFANFGPNATTFIIPAEIFPARLRSTCHGISGAFGKIGAIIGVFGFLHTEKHVRCVLLALVGCNLIGLMFTFLLPESKAKSLEEITGEMEQPVPQDDDPAAVAVAEYVYTVPT